MNKLLTTLTLAFFATVAFNAQAASHAGGAPMKKASEPAAKASAPMKDEKKAEEKKK